MQLLTGAFPAEMGLLTNLRKFGLWGCMENMCNQNLKYSLTLSSQIETLWTYSNLLAGPIPPEFGTLQELREFPKCCILEQSFNYKTSPSDTLLLST